MSRQKFWILALLVTLAFLATGIGGIRDMLSTRWQITSAHAWNDGRFFLLLAILVALVLK